MRYHSIILFVLAVMAFAAACDRDNPPEVPRTVPPNMKGTITTIEAPAIKPELLKPARPVVHGEGPICET